MVGILLENQRRLRGHQLNIFYLGLLANVDYARVGYFLIDTAPTHVRITGELRLTAINSSVFFFAFMAY